MPAAQFVGVNASPGGPRLYAGDPQLEEPDLQASKAEPMGDDHSHMTEASAYMVIAIAKGLIPCKVGPADIRPLAEE